MAIYIKFGGDIGGDNLEVLAFQVAAGHAVASRGNGAPNVSEIVVTKNTDKSSPKLFEACSKGTHIPVATIVAQEGTDYQKLQPYLKFYLKDVLISGYNLNAAEGGGNPTEQISLNYSKIEFTFTEGGSFG